MKTTIRILSVMTLSFFFYINTKSQTVKPILENEKQIVFKIAGYSIDTDKLIHKEFTNDNDLKIVYTCIPTGILVFESKNIIDSKKKDEILSRLKKAHEAIEFLHMQGFSLKEAEEKCSSKRSVN